MRSPKFDIRQAKLKPLFTSGNLRRIWKEKVRDAMKKQFLIDPIEHLDFHQRLGTECTELERAISNGSYTPTTNKRILVEKSKGLCRQLVIPSIRDALVLQALSDELYRDIRGRAPSDNAHFEPQDHKFSNSDKLFDEPEYGTFKAWLDFQKTIFRFSEEKPYLIITDVANFYDSISYVHLRNIISDLIPVREPILDMLIYVLSGMLWQPDYMPRVEVGLPQLNLDAPRILAHSFLYELDEYLSKHIGPNFVRFMDDIDVGVDSVQDAKRALKAIDLVLQTRQIRLNSGKTQILSREEAKSHFRIRENIFLDRLTAHIDRRAAAGASLDRERRWIASTVRTLHRKRRFDLGNGEKILKRTLSIASRIGVEIDNKTLLDTLIRRPGSRTSALRLISRLPLNRARTTIVRKFLGSDLVVDDASYIDVSNYIVESVARTSRYIHDDIEKIIEYTPTDNNFGMYAHLWLSSKYKKPDYVIDILDRHVVFWRDDQWISRLAGGLYPIFINTEYEGQFRNLITRHGSPCSRDVFGFHDELRRDIKRFDMSFNWLRAVNHSRRSGVSHPRLLLLATALSNSAVAPGKKARLISTHQAAWADFYYRKLVSRTSGVRVAATPLSTYPLP